MALNIDTARALRTQEQLGALVRAVAAASPGDESRAVEWKSGYPDLRDTHASFAIARAVLGLANRPVSIAQSIFEGVGYIVVGAEPGRIAGQAMPDNADILTAISRYTGRSFPLWDPRSVEVDGRQVLVVTVEPPRAGDRIALLQKSYQPPEKALVAEGTIFVRHPGSTERASRLDIEQLQDRLLDGTEAATAAARAEDQRRELRELLADTVEAGHSWFSIMQILTLMTASSDWKQKDWIEWVNTDSGKQAAADAQLIQRNTRKMRLLGAPRAVLAALEQAEAEMSRANNFDGIHSQRPSTGEARSSAYQHLNAVKARFAALEAAGIAALQPEG